MRHKKSLLLYYFIFIAIISSTLFIISGCESSRVGPDVPRPNPPAPIAQPITLTAYVRDISTLAPIAGATVKIAKTNNSVLATLLTDINGKYSYDVTAVSDNSVIVNANKDGYGFSSKIAEIKKALNIAISDDVLLTKLQKSTAQITPLAGGQVTAVNNQTISQTPITVIVPPNSVSNFISLSVAPMPTSQVPKLQTSANSIQFAVQFGPSGTIFTLPITVKFPLPNKQAVGKTFNLLKLNESTNVWASTGIIATVDTTGTLASAKLSSFSTYGSEDPLNINVPTGSSTTTDEDQVTLAEGTMQKNYSQTVNITIAVNGFVDSAWLLGEVIKKADNISFGTTTKVVSFNLPQLPANYVENGVQINPDNKKESGNWIYKWYIVKTTTTKNWTASGGTVPNTFSGNGQILEQKIDIDAVRSGWIWIPHNQGGGN